MAERQYLCLNEYTAKGEGLCIWLSLETAETEDEAIRKHRDRFGYDLYFVPWTEAVEVTDENRTRIKLLIRRYFSNEISEFLLEGVHYIAPFKSDLHYFWGFGDKFRFHIETEKV